MELLGYEICTPSLVYVVIGIILALVMFLLNLSMTGFSSLSHYPKPKSYIENISIQCDDSCRRKKHNDCGCRH